MNLATLNLQKKTLKMALDDLEAIKPRCDNCKRFSGGQCVQFDAAPPSEWIIGPVECEHWEFDGIPF